MATLTGKEKSALVPAPSLFPWVKALPARVVTLAVTRSIKRMQ